MWSTRPFSVVRLLCAAVAVVFLSISPALADAPSADPPAPTLSVHPSAVAALKAILEETLREVPGGSTGGAGPLVLSFGEYHQTTDTAKKGKGAAVLSTLHRFTADFLPVLGQGASDLILETWITDGNCGKQETAAVNDVQTTTKRPAATEDEIVTLVKQAKAIGITPHILKLSCDDYKSLFSAGEVDYQKLLRLITDLLRKKIVDVTHRRQGESSRKQVLIYGGALHNDITPQPDLAGYSYGPALQKEFGKSYVELDLYVPEFIEHNESITKEPWYAEYKKRARPGRAVVVRRSPGSYILVFPRGSGH